MGLYDSLSSRKITDCTAQVEGKQAYGRLSYLGGEVMKRLRERGRKPPMGGFGRSKK